MHTWALPGSMCQCGGTRVSLLPDLPHSERSPVDTPPVLPPAPPPPERAPIHKIVSRLPELPLTEPPMTIHKFSVPIGDELRVPMPQGATLLTVEAQGDQPCIWALVNPHLPTVDRKFAWRGAGHAADGLVPAMYIGSIRMLKGELILHLFDRGEASPPKPVLVKTTPAKAKL